MRSSIKLGTKLICWISACVVVTGFFGLAQLRAPGERVEKDSTGREWHLKDWGEAYIKPYLNSLKERELRYRQKWGEDWYGPGNNCRIHNPGNWKWDTVDVVPPEMATRIKGAPPADKNIWGNRYNITIHLWAPGGQEVSDIYVASDNCIYHLDPVSGRRVFIGKPEEGGLKDGSGESARMQPSEVADIDPVSGRLYLVESHDKKVLRYVEKLIPFEDTLSGKVFYLPAVLDWHDLYRKVNSPSGGPLKPVTVGKRRDPVFVVRSSSSSFGGLYLPGAQRGKRPLITLDGKGVYFLRSYAPPGLTNFQLATLFDIKSGKTLGNLILKGSVPENYAQSGQEGPGTHGGTCMGFDGRIYTAQHGGCCGPCGSHPGRLFSVDPKTGEISILYDSIPADGVIGDKSKSPIVDGPADALSLKFTSTLWQTQCPRTGAIINGGWDASGIRRYHDGFVTSIVNPYPPARTGWDRTAPLFENRNCNPSVAPNGDLYIPDVKSREPRIIRIYRTDWPKEQPVNGYAEEFLPREKLEALMLGYAKEYIESYLENNRLLEPQGAP